MNKAIAYLFNCNFRNNLKLLRHKPLKFVGILISTAYFIALPFFMIDMFRDMGIDNPNGFVVFGSFFALYLSLPSILTYFKRKGVLFLNSDVNFIFATPVPPKWGLIYGLFKNIYLKMLMQLVVPVIAIFLFHVSVLQALLYMICDFVLSNIISYSLASIMYGSEKISERQKKIIPLIVYAFMGVVTLWFGYEIYLNGFTLASLAKVVTGPVFLLIPYIGWQVGLLNLIIYGASTIRIISTVLYVSLALVLFYSAKQMKCTGDYYEEALSFADNYEQAIERNKNGSFQFFGRKSKINKSKAVLSGKYASVIFGRQVLSYRRQHRYLVRFGDILHLAIGIFILFIINDGGEAFSLNLFFYVIMGISIYFGVFFSALNTWRREFDHYSLYLIPDKNINKLFYATLLEHVSSLFRGILLITPIAIGAHISLLNTILGILVFMFMKSVIVYVGILFKDIIGSHVGKSLASILTMFVNMLALAIPLGIGAAVIILLNSPVWLAFISVIIYCTLIDWVGLSISARSLVHIEALDN